MKTYESKCEQAISPDIANGVSYVLKGVLAPEVQRLSALSVCRMLQPRRPVRTITPRRLVVGYTRAWRICFVGGQ